MISLKLRYKGSRNYLHGSDIYNAIVNSLGNEFTGHLARLVFGRVARNQIKISMSEQVSLEKVVGRGTWRTSIGEQIQFWLIESALPVTESYEFDESAITAGALIDNEIIRGVRSNAYTLIENIVTLTKCLNHSLAPDVKGKWLFGQINLEGALPHEWSNLAITRTHLVGNAFSRNNITINGREFGQIRFIVGTP